MVKSTYGFRYTIQYKNINETDAEFITIIIIDYIGWSIFILLLTRFYHYYDR